MAKRIEKLDNERWKGWDWAASNKLNEVIEAVNTLTERVDTLEKGTNHSNSVYGAFESRIFDLEEQIRELNPDLPTQVEPDKDTVVMSKDTTFRDETWMRYPSEPDTEQWEVASEYVYDGSFQVTVIREDGRYFKSIEQAHEAADKIRNLLKGQS